MKRCLACVMIALLVFVAPAFPAGAAGFELPEGTQLTAQSVYIVNLDTGLCVYEKNADEKRSVASLTKLRRSPTRRPPTPIFFPTKKCAPSTFCMP